MLRHRNVQRRILLPPERKDATNNYFNQQKAKWSKTFQLCETASEIDEEATLENKSKSSYSSNSPKRSKYKPIMVHSRLDLDNLKPVSYKDSNPSFWTMIYNYTQAKKDDKSPMRGVVEELS